MDETSARLLKFKYKLYTPNVRFIGFECRNAEREIQSNFVQDEIIFFVDFLLLSIYSRKLTKSTWMAQQSNEGERAPLIGFNVFRSDKFKIPDLERRNALLIPINHDTNKNQSHTALSIFYS